MKLSNQQIYYYTQNLHNNFGISCELTLPIKINFFLQKNITVLSGLAQEIEKARINIAKTHGTINEDGNAYTIPLEAQTVVNTELQELFLLEQEVPLYTFKLEDFEGLEFTFAQMNALMFMIEE